ncbi:UNVERIFIED_CONTAM: hypothetical protein GTU68_023062 [Idotea baltica]|nr:hypothetical protein [Idotea baltica]
MYQDLSMRFVKVIL